MNALLRNPNFHQNLEQKAEFTLRQNLMEEFQDKDYRYAYAESFLNTKLASQVKTLRQQRDLTQAQVADLMCIKQPGYARFEDVNHSVWKTDTLWDIARALDVRVNISFESFGSLIEEKEHFDKDHLERPAFNDDPVFKIGSRYQHRRKRRIYGVNMKKNSFGLKFKNRELGAVHPKPPNRESYADIGGMLGRQEVLNG